MEWKPVSLNYSRKMMIINSIIFMVVSQFFLKYPDFIKNSNRNFWILLVVSLILHEMIHLFFWRLLAKKRKKPVITFNWKMMGVLLYLEAEYSKKQLLWIRISPFVVITIFAFIVMKINPYTKDICTALIRANMFISYYDLYSAWIIDDNFEKNVTFKIENENLYYKDVDSEVLISEGIK